MYALPDVPVLRIELDQREISPLERGDLELVAHLLEDRHHVPKRVLDLARDERVSPAEESKLAEGRLEDRLRPGAPGDRVEVENGDRP